jgi:hypothetical protein
LYCSQFSLVAAVFRRLRDHPQLWNTVRVAVSLSSSPTQVQKNGGVLQNQDEEARMGLSFEADAAYYLTEEKLAQILNK